jgi:excinuclease ABC subunit C
VYLPGQKNPIALEPNSPELFLLALARDEAHRFANRGRKRTSHARRWLSELDRIGGIGPKTKKTLLEAFGSYANVLGASDQQILALRGVTRRHLQALRSSAQALRSSASAKQETSGEPAPGSNR